MNDIGGSPSLDVAQGQPDLTIEETYKTANEDVKENIIQSNKTSSLILEE